MEDEFWIKLREFVQSKLTCLIDEEPLGYGMVVMPPSEYMKIELEERTFYVVAKKVFYRVLNETLIEATIKFPQSFGTGDPDKVLHALHDAHPFYSFDDFKQLLHDDQFALVIEFTDNKINDKVLRVELYRLIYNNSSEFTGGLLHAFKHFSFKDVPLSTGKGEYPLEHPQSIFNYFIKAFFLDNIISKKNKDKYESIVPIDSTKSMKIGLYLQPKCGVYFINTVHIVNA